MDSDFGYCTSRRTPERRSSSEHFVVEDLLDFSNDDGVVVQDDPIFEENTNSNNSSDSSNVVTPPGSDNSFSGNNDAGFPDIGTSAFSDTHFSGELCVPYEDLAELEWLSNFVEESFSSEDLQKSHLSALSSVMKTRPELIESSEARRYNTDTSRPDNETAPKPRFNPEMPVPGKARSKRSRAASCNWTSRLKVLSNGSSDQHRSIQIGQGPDPLVKPVKSSSKRKSGSGQSPRLGSGSGSGSDISNGEVRKCLHCATDKTPQWRTGPMGPKTLCNACGVRYKSGRLVPEYRPASSPTFVMTKHSNSHRKVIELRRQKELQKQHQYIQHQHQHYHQQQQLIIHSNHPSNMIFDPANTDDYLIHQHIGPDYRQLT